MNTTTRYLLCSRGFDTAFRLRLALIALLGVMCLCTPRASAWPFWIEEIIDWWHTPSRPPSNGTKTVSLIGGAAARPSK